MYLGAMNQVVGEWAVMREDVQMCLYATLTGMALYFVVLFRMKFRFTNQKLFDELRPHHLPLSMVGYAASSASSALGALCGLWHGEDTRHV